MEEEKTDTAGAVLEETAAADEAVTAGDAMPAGDPGDEAAAPRLEPLKLDGVKQKGPRVPLPSSLQEIVGALLFASSSPLTAGELRTCIRGVAPEEGDDAEVMSVYQSCTSREVEQALHGLEKELERSGCGFRLVCAGGAYRLQTAPACGRYVRSMLKLDKPSRLSRASLETLAIIAYRQPITKAEIEQIRGVAVDTIVKSLVELQLVRLVGRSELPGHPFLYGTSPVFLEHFGLSSLSELNEIDPTLQRSNPRERAKMFVKEKKAEEPQTETNPATNSAGDAAADSAGDAAANPAANSAGDATAKSAADSAGDAEPAANEPGEGESSKPGRVSFRPDDDELLDDEEDEFADDDEPLIDADDDGDDGDDDADDDGDDDEPLIDADGDGDDGDDDDGDDDEPLTDDDEEDEFDDDDDDEGEDEDEE